MRSIVLGFTVWSLCLATSGVAGAQAPAAPAKALLKVDKLPAEPLDVAVYEARATSFEKPLALVRGVGAAGAEIPAGTLLVALRSGRKAPDLHRLTVKPGASAHLEFRPHEGWSLVVRASNGQTHQPTASAMVSLRTAAEGDAPGQPAGEEKTGEDGLALFSGISAPRVDAAVSHADYLPQALPGLTGASGALDFRDAVLERGGRVRAVVQSQGRPAPGAHCRMLQRPDPAAGPQSAPPAVLYEGMTDAAGVCQSGRVPAGTYLFSVLPRKGKGTQRHTVTLVEGQDLEERFTLAELRVHGTVTQGQGPAQGLVVSALETHEGPPAEVARAITGPDGVYELMLSQPGRYNLRLLAMPQSTKGVERAVTVKGADTVVDFTIQRAVIHGRITDDQGRPIAGAWVKLHWNDEPESTQETDKQGEFAFLLGNPGSGTLTAGKDGYQDSDVQEYEMDEESVPPPLLLMLQKAKPPG
jgi:hypothetical protein